MKILLLFALALPLSAATVTLRVTADSISGSSNFFGTQSWYPENETFYNSVASSGFDVILSYDTASSPFNVSGALGSQFNASILSGAIGGIDVGSITNLSAFVSLGVGGSSSLMVTLRELPFGELTHSYVWNDSIFVFFDTDNTLSTTSLPDGATLAAVTDTVGASVRNSRGGNILAARETGNGASDGVSFAFVPEPSTSLILALGAVGLLGDRRRR